MRTNPADDPLPGRFKQALTALYGGRIDRVILFDWRARGEAHEDSGYDVAVFLKPFGDRWQELDRLADLASSPDEADRQS